MKNIIKFVILAFIVRLGFSFLPSFDIDMNAWLGWASRMVEVGPDGFYSDAVWTQYTPGILYWLWFIGHLGWFTELAIKLPVITADVATGVLIWKIISEKSQKLANISFFIYILSPIVIFTGSVWGQIDGILTLFMVGSFYLFRRKRFFISALLFAIAFLLKPQALVILPALLYVGYLNKYKVSELIKFIGVIGVAIVMFSLPFFASDPVFGIVRLVEKMTAYYSYTSVFAFNLWGVIGMWQPDSLTFAGLSYHMWGIVIFAISQILIFWKFRKSIHKSGTQYLVVALSLLAAFLFPTRVHERYLFPMFAFLLISAGITKSRALFASYGMFTILNFLNLYHPYAYYTDNFLKSEWLLDFTGNMQKLISILMIFVFSMVVFFKKQFESLVGQIVEYIKTRIISRQVVTTKEDSFPGIKSSRTKTKYLLILILAFAFVTRVYALSSPPSEYFDEVYHAFTARQIMHGEVKAWEWWTTPPEGFAYEWTHPPIAKYGMVLGMSVLGENSFGWRFPSAILGVISVFLVYKIAKELFKDEFLGLLAGFILSLDGLFLVISRIGMNDIYFLTFALACFYFFIINKWFASAVFLGLSLASKWSALWLIPVLIVSHFVFRKKLGISYFWMIVLPPTIYLASYILFFLQGHSFAQFYNLEALGCIGKAGCTYTYGLQQQMWWYHTNLNATHSYTSAWWSWPLMLRPVYLYTSELVSGMVARIYLIGNPIVFWLGAISVFVSGIIAFVTKNRKLGMVVFCYFVFFVPWAVSPRIMFLYHYLPSLPFLAIATAYVLRKHPRLIPPAIVVMSVTFLYFYPHWAGLSVPEWLDSSYYWLPSWR